MTLPKLVDNKILASLASPSDAFAVRVIVRRVVNNAPYRIHGKIRHYLAAFDKALGAHCIDVPLSVWMDGIATGIYRDNLSVAHDLQGNRSQSMAPLVFLVIPWKQAAAPAVAVPDASAGYVLGIDAPEPPYAPEVPAPAKDAAMLERMRKMRETAAANRAAKAESLM